MLKRKILKVERTCEWCNKKFLTAKRGISTTRFCSRHCVGFYSNSLPQTKQAITKRMPLIKKKCYWCKKIFYIRPCGKVSKMRKFCSKRCCAQWRVNRIEWRKNHSQAMKGKIGYWRGKKRPDISLRMKLYNPMFNPITLEKMKKSMKGKTFLARGGNGQITIPQKILWEKLKLPKKSLEYPILTKDVKHLFKSVPNCYKVDIAIPKIKLAIEVDGMTHKLKKWKFLDKRKTEILNKLGWKVLRFWNQEIIENLPKVIKEIQKYTILK